jgi:hypothetical protein
MRSYACVLLAACANAPATIDAGTPKPDAEQAAEVVTLPLDSGMGDASDAAFDAGCAADAALGGVGLPTGTTASATTTYDPDTPDLVVDGDPNTYWNAGAVTGSLTITFPSPQTFTGVRLAVTALPACDETYAITGFQDAVPISIGQSTESVAEGTTILPTIGVTIGTYDAIRIDVTSTASWVAIGEVGLVTAECP